MRLAAFAALLLPLAACGEAGAGVPGTGSGPARQFAVADFTAVAATGSDDVDVRTGGGFSVRAEGDPVALDHLRIWRERNTLRIGNDGSRWVHNVKPATVFVTMPRIAAAAVAGSGNIVIDKVTGGGFKGNSAGSGDLTVHALAVDSLGLSIAGSGDMAMTGHARSLDVSVAGSGGVDGAGLAARTASINVLGSGSVRARVEGAASVAMMGSGSVDLGGKARCSVTKMGSGSVTCGG
ncbi:head GIN domain-containing protein [uncultured Sphingomonas sp.]|uniref:head GIN domain-containing protein n=1 Tax=uncultured Sphingomonas sp. TaxID=158754 RepID=UPI0035C9C65D